jgi:hypothetical protein
MPAPSVCPSCLSSSSLPCTHALHGAIRVCHTDRCLLVSHRYSRCCAARVLFPSRPPSLLPAVLQGPPVRPLDQGMVLLYSVYLFLGAGAPARAVAPPTFTGAAQSTVVLCCKAVLCGWLWVCGHSEYLWSECLFSPAFVALCDLEASRTNTRSDLRHHEWHALILARIGHEQFEWERRHCRLVLLNLIG